VTELVGRAAELRRGEEALSALRSGTAGVLVVAGEPGIGKTRLVEEILAAAERRGYVTLSAAGGELERDLPFGVVADALDPYVAAAGAAALEGLAPDDLGHLSAMLPSLSRSGPSPSMTLTQERYRAYRAVGELLVRLASRRPLVVALDDLHWADPASVELISYLLRHTPDAPVLLILAFRRHQAPARDRKSVV
jgi:predicted ATPase